MHRIAFLLLAILAAALPTAAQADCRAPAVPSIVVKIAQSPVEQDRSLSIAALSKLPSESRRPGMESYDQTLGLTDASLEANAQMQMLTTLTGSTGICTTMGETTVIIAWKTLVHIAAEIVPGSCIDKVVTKHEQRHVDLEQKLMPIARAAVQAAMTGVARRGTSGATIEESRRLLQGRAKAAIDRALAVFEVERLRRQLEFDTREEYDKVPRACGQADFQKLLHS